MLEVGIRVVRGPNWKWNSQDNGEGHVGTVVEIGRQGSPSSPDKTVVVQWDLQARTNYRVGYQDAYDLRTFDNAPAGVRHPNVVCDGCKDHGISGMLWKCSVCFDVDLCTTCYMNDTHDLNHPFRRFDTASAVGFDVPPRLNSTKIVSKGIFAGARVVRGPDWDWGNQDGGEGKIGRVVDIRGWDNDSGRSVANVIWSSGSTNVYRLGHKGKVDLKCVQSSSAGSYYVDHLPVLGKPSSTISRASVAGTTGKSGVSGKVQYSWNVGDKVQVIQEISKLKELQEGHGGWNPKMAEFIGKPGRIHRVTDKGDIRVQYDSGIRWTFNPSCINPILTFAVGDVVQVINDYNKVKELQKGHGEWVDVMKEVLGRTGTVAKVYADNDLRIVFDNNNSTWTMNPLAVRIAPPDRFDTNNSMYAITNRRDDNMSHDPMSSMLPHLLDDLTLDNSYTVERFVREAAQGRIESVKKMLPKMKDKIMKNLCSKDVALDFNIGYYYPSLFSINQKDSGKTPLQVAAHQGHIGIIHLLIANGASLEITDEDGDTALHYSAFGNQPHVMELLLKAGAAVNACNRGKCSPLHVAVNKQFLECVKVLLKFKCNVNSQDSYGDSALHDAIGKENSSIVDCLINTPGVDFTLKNNRGFNILHHSALKGNQYAVEKILQKARQLVDVKKDDGFSALHLSCLNGHYGVTKILVEEGSAEIDIRNNRKQTPLLLAVSQGYCALVEYLVSRGANVNASDEDDDSCLHVILTRHFDVPSNSQHSQAAQAHLTNPVTAVELRKHDNAPAFAEIWSNLLSCGWNASDDDIGGATLACFMALAGGDLSKLNRRGVTPFDLARSERLKEMLAYYSAQNRLKLSTRDLLSSSTEDKNALLKGRKSASTTTTSQQSQVGTSSPHLGVTTVASTVVSTDSLRGECLLCSEITHLVTFEPCNHRIACEECCIRMKKCLTCQQSIDRKILHGTPITSSSSSSLRVHPTAERLLYLENKFAEIEETYCCSICMERRRNVAFLCGHMACERCAESLTTCHMCRQTITQKINLY